MKRNTNRFPVSISTGNFNKQPTKEQWDVMNYKLHFLDIYELSQFVIDGYNICPYFKDTEGEKFDTNAILNENFRESYLVASNVESYQYLSLEVFCERVDFKPSLAFKNRNEDAGRDNSYTLLYVFNKPIQSHCFYSELCTAIGKKLKEEFANEVDVLYTQATSVIDGNILRSPQVFSNSCAYDFSDFVADSTANRSNLPEESNSIVSPVKEAVDILDLEFRRDFFGIRDEETYGFFKEKYKDKYPFFDKTPLPEVDENTMNIILPENYIEIKRCRGKVNGSADERLRKLRINARLRKKIMPDISIEHLLYCMCWERQYYFNNSDGIIKNKVLFDVCVDVLKCSEIRIKTPKRKNGFKVNPKFCAEYEVSPQSIAAHLKGQAKRDEFKRYYNPGLSKKENLELFKEKGIDIKQSTLYKYIKQYEEDTTIS